MAAAMSRGPTYRAQAAACGPPPDSPTIAKRSMPSASACVVGLLAPLRRLPARYGLHMMRRALDGAESSSSGERLRMQITVEAGDITESDSPCIVVNLFEGITVPGGATGAVDQALVG